MSLQITLTNGNLLTAVPDTQLVSTYGGVDLIGTNYADYGTVLNDNIVHMVEHFADSVPPTNPLVGQIWYDTVRDNINFWDGTAFKSISVIYSSNTAPIDPQLGDEWFDIINGQLFIWNGYEWILVGPPGNFGGGKEGWVIARTLSGTYYLELYANNQLLAIVSAVALPNSGITGFANIRPGFNYVTSPDSPSGIVTGGLYNITELTVGGQDQIALTTDDSGFNTGDLIMNGNLVLVACSDGYESGEPDSSFATNQLFSGNIFGSIYANCVVANTYIGLPTANAIPGSEWQVLYSTGGGLGGWDASANLTVNDSIGLVTASNLTVTGSETVDGTLTVNGNIYVGGFLNGNSTGSYTKYTTAIISNLSVTSYATVYGPLTVTGASTLEGTVSVSSNINLGSSTWINNLGNFSNSVNIAGNLTVQGSALVDNNLQIDGQLNVEGAATFNYGASAFTLPNSRGASYGSALLTNALGGTMWGGANIASYGNNSLTTNGYQVFPGGLILQWGVGAAPSGEGVSTTVYFPVNFHTTCLNVSLTSAYSSSTGTMIVSLDTMDFEKFTWWNGAGAYSDGIREVYWIAIGF